MIGQLIGHYKVVRKIGDGGMGSVFEAVHQSIGRKCAVKVLHPRFSQNAQIVTRFFNEARAVNIVNHPGIVGCFDFGQLPDGTAYIVMEYLDGESLSHRIKRLNGPFGTDALRIGRQIAAALSAAHNKGIIHRDLKPDNVIIVSDSEAPGGERAKVLDFGIAKIINDQGGGQNSNGLTKMGAVMGTPAFMSPEQCRGANNIDGKSDVYALGVLLFLLLTGKAPFEAEAPSGLMAAHLFLPAPSLMAIEPTVTPAVEQLVLQMLAKEPKDRPAMVEVMANLERIGAYATSAQPIVRRPAASQQQMLSQPTVVSDSSGGMSPLLHMSSSPENDHGPTTIDEGPGPQPEPQPQPKPPPQPQGEPRRPIAMAVAIAVIIAGIAATALVLRLPHRILDRARAHSGAGGPRRVVWTLSTQPPGADVVRASDGVVVGKTPWRLEDVAGKGTIVLTLRQSGYADKSVTFDRAKDCSDDVQLSLAADSSDKGADANPNLNPNPNPTKKGQPSSDPTPKGGPKKPKKKSLFQFAPVY